MDDNNVDTLSQISFEFILVPPSCWRLKHVLGLTWIVPALAPSGLRNSWTMGQEQGTSGHDKQILFQEHPTPQGDAKRKPPPRALKKNLPTNNLAAAVAREMMRDACGAASCSAEPLPPPQGGILLVSSWGRGARPGKQEPEDHIPPLSLVVLRVEGMDQTIG